MATPASSINALRKDLLRIATKRCAHVSSTTVISAPDATDLASAATLASAIRAALVTHAASVCNEATGIGAHLAADTTPLSTVPLSTDLLRGWTAEAVAWFNGHSDRDDLHFHRDSANRVASLATANSTRVLCRLLNKLKSAVNAHMASALGSEAAEEVEA